MSEPQSSRRRNVRSKNGCVTCRIRKVKCNEQRPVCDRCVNSPTKCEWLEPGRALSSRRAATTKNQSAPGSSRSSPRRLFPIESAPQHPEDIRGRDDSKATTKLSPLAHQMSIENSHAPQPTLSTRHIPLANSLQLSIDDQQAFLYIPESLLVLCYGKLWKWSCFSYIYTNIASQYSGVMRSFIAIASMELRSRELLAIRESNDSARSLEQSRRMTASAAVHYSLALKDLSTLLDHICNSEGQSNDIDALFTMWFLILRYEAYDSESTAASRVHLDGIRSFLKPYIQADKYGSGKKLPYVSQTMLLYTLYLDADSATGNLHSGKFCMDFSSRDANNYISHDHLFRSARSILPKIWGGMYPVSELLDDLENYRPLQTQDKPDSSDAQKLWQYIENLGDEFADILLLAKLVPDSGGKRLIWTVYAATLDFYALQVLYSSQYPGPEAQSRLNLILPQIVAIASKGLKEDPRQIYRFMWSLSVALFKSQDQSDQQWLSAQLEKARVLLPNFGAPGLILGQCDGPQPA
ncbi:hypothetical protein NM208_g15530 [Fusarium decemcellulare]|uniref:Uncharacterized protein n=1 Tax=Fusarium decemcellulare TaxID=57161 RepID=A0ACC1REI5_9HYPO|nr:hypothetical protein NM208_g15530 [Fusarium decemcellulare]